MSRGRSGNRRRASGARDLIGRDLVRLRTDRRGGGHRGSLALLLAALLAALALAALRVDILRLRYALAEALEQEKALLERRRSETARVASLRDPARLAALAESRGLAPTARVVELAPDRRMAGAQP